MVFHALSIFLGRIDGNANSKQQFDHEAMSHAHTCGKLLAGFGQKYASVRPGGD